MTMPRVVAISQPGQRRAIQKVADLFTGFSLITRRRGRWHQATAIGHRPPLNGATGCWFDRANTYIMRKGGITGRTACCLASPFEILC
jgi:hypothetical protein